MKSASIAHDTAAGKAEIYENLRAELAAILTGERDFSANLANTAAVLFHGLPDLNWAGFYHFKQGQLVLGPFQGKPACVRIDMGRGVCGTAAQRKETVIVPDVHAFPGHIACDANSQSEIVVPLICKERFLGVMDLDSPSIGRFDSVDAGGLQAIARIVIEASDF